MKSGREVDEQRSFYDSRPHEHLQPADNDYYAGRIVRELARGIEMASDARILEIGAGFGRFTFHLLDHCRSLVALDLSSVALESLRKTRDDRGIPDSRCETLCSDLYTLDRESLAERFDFIVGFFVLHHLPDYGEGIQKLAGFLNPDGQMAFVEPNRRNPLFALQVAICADMTWAHEKGMFTLSAQGVMKALLSANLEAPSTRRFGFFPPQVVNRSPLARRIEMTVERIAILKPLLPFLLMSAKSSHDHEQRALQRSNET